MLLCFIVGSERAQMPCISHHSPRVGGQPVGRPLGASHPARSRRSGTQAAL